MVDFSKPSLQCRMGTQYVTLMLSERPVSQHVSSQPQHSEVLAKGNGASTSAEQVQAAVPCSEVVVEPMMSQTAVLEEMPVLSITPVQTPMPNSVVPEGTCVAQSSSPQVSHVLPPKEFVWAEGPAKLFFTLYKKKCVLLDKGTIRTQKQLYSAIAAEMNKFGYLISSPQVESRYKTLERLMKSFIKTSKKTGRGRRKMMYENEVFDMFKNKHNIIPAVLSGRHGVTTREQVLHKKGIAVTSNVAGIVQDNTLQINVSDMPSVASDENTPVCSGSSYNPSVDGKVSLGNAISACSSKSQRKDGKMAIAVSAMKEELNFQNQIMKEDLEEKRRFHKQIEERYEKLLQEQSESN